MKKSNFTEPQIVFALRQAKSGVTVAEVCRKLGISDATFYSALSAATAADWTTSVLENGFRQ